MKIIGVIDTITKIKMIPGVARTLESNTRNKVDVGVIIRRLRRKDVTSVTDIMTIVCCRELGDKLPVV